jgi:starvation-inducible outer membrane lipoprotein
MPRSALAATALALIVGACLALPSQAGAEQSSSQSASKPVWDAGNGKATETRQPGDHTVTAEALKNAKETDRLMRRLNEAALWTGTNEQIRARSIRFR